MRNEVSFGPFVFSVEAGQLWHDGVSVTLKPKERALLALLAERRPGTVSRDEIFERLWNGSASDPALSQTVYRLRQALAKYDPGDYIRTIPDVGFQLVGGGLMHALNDRPDSLRPHFAAYQRAAKLYATRTEDGTLSAIQLLEEICAADGEFQSALLLLAKAYTNAGIRLFYPPTEAYWNARLALERAIELDERNADAFATLSTLLLFYNGNRAHAQKLAEHALLLAPASPIAHTAAFWERLSRRDYEYALTQADLSVSVTPTSQQATALVGTALYMAGRYDEAIRTFKSALSLDEGHSTALFYMACARTMQGDFADATRLLNRISGADMSTRVAAVRGYIASKQRDAAGTNEAIQRLTSMKFPSEVSLAAVYVADGHLDKARDVLLHALHTREPGLFLVAVDPMYEPLWRDAKLMKKIETGRPLQCDRCGTPMNTTGRAELWRRETCWNCRTAVRPKAS